jgi:non-ribosomal peptide synthetase component F
MLLCIALNATRVNLHISRNLNIHPLFQVMVSLQNSSSDLELNLSSLQTKLLAIDYHQAKFDLTIDFEKHKDGCLKVAIEYATDLFEDSTIERMAGHLLKVIESVCDDANQNIGEIDILTATEKHQQLVEWNQTEADYPKDKTIQQLFEEQAEKTPDNIAVVFEDKRLTYKKLNEQANQFAHYLRSVGVGPETILAFCLERSLEMMVTILGIIKAGGAYLPIDPSYPDDRINYMLEDSNATLMISQSSLRDKITHCKKLLLIEEITDNLAKQPMVVPFCKTVF